MPGPYWCIRLTTRVWKNRLHRLPPRKDYRVYVTRSTYHYAYARQTQVIRRKETKKREEEKGKGKKRTKMKKERKEKSYEPTSTSKTCFRVFLVCRDERNPHNKISSSSSSSSRSRSSSLAVARAATAPKTWPRSTPKNTETGDASRGASPRTIQTAFFFFWPDFTLFGRTDALLAAQGSLLFFCQCFGAGVITSFNGPSFYVFLANHSAVIQPHPMKGADIDCCIQAGGILAVTQVCRAGCTPLCAGRCARLLFVLLVVPFLLLS